MIKKQTKKQNKKKQLWLLLNFSQYNEKWNGRTKYSWLPALASEFLYYSGTIIMLKNPNHPPGFKWHPSINFSVAMASQHVQYYPHKNFNSIIDLTHHTLIEHWPHQQHLWIQTQNLTILMNPVHICLFC